jgi:hypothetical protein
MANFIKKNVVTTDDKWDVIGFHGHSVGEIRYSVSMFGFFPNQRANTQGLRKETLQEIVDFMTEKTGQL